MKVTLGAAWLGAGFIAVATIVPTTASAQAKPGQLGWDKLPDWSGVWSQSVIEPLDRATVDPPNATGQEPYARMRPPYNAEYEAKYTAIIEKHKAGQFFDPLSYCLPMGFPRMLTAPFNWEFIVRPEGVHMIAELLNTIRRIHTDGRTHLPEEVRYPMWNGDSVGHWEGQGEGATLVVDTVSLREGIMDRTEAPMSDKMHVAERIRKVDPNTIVDEITIEDPVTMTKPFHVTRTWKKQTYPYAHLMDWSCEENNRVVKGGETGTHIILPGEEGFDTPGTKGFEVLPDGKIKGR